MKNSRLPRREREKLAQREDMLATALELFSRKGYANVSMHEIAQAAEFAIGTLYKFFKSKEDLYRALIKERHAKLHDALMQALTGPEKEIDKLRMYVRTKGELFRANAALVRLYFSETQGVKFNPMLGLDSEIKEKHRQFLQALAGVFKSGMKAKRFEKIGEPYYLAVAIENITNAFLFMWIEEPETHCYPEDLDTVLNILFKALVRVRI